MSSFFSGMGTDCLAASAVELGMHHVGVTLELPHISVCDNSKDCRALLECIVHDEASIHIVRQREREREETQKEREGEERERGAREERVVRLVATSLWKVHVLDDVTGRLVLKTSLANKSYNQMVRLVQQAKLAPASICTKHNNMCTIPTPDVDMSGSPCWEWSRAGRRAGYEGKAPSLFWMWATLNKLQGTPLLIHENVVGFPDEMLRQALTPDYEVYLLKVSTRDVGFGNINRRDRHYHIAVNTSKLEVPTNTILQTHGNTLYNLKCMS